MKILTSEQMKIVEERENQTGTKYIRLMENAGSACARFIRETFKIKTATIVCGSGKNGGDGFVIVRKLCESGIDTAVILAAGNSRAADAIEMLDRIKDLPIKVLNFAENKAECEPYFKSDIIVDAIFGIGFYGEPNSTYSELFDKINASNSITISIDIPSGLESDTGKVNGNSIKADYTLAISNLKPVHVTFPAAENCGKVVTLDIGIDESCYSDIGDSTESIEKDDVKKKIIPRKADSNKGNFGHVLCICGSKKMPGAAVLSVKGAVRCGAGLVTAAIPEKAYTAVSSHTVESLILPLESDEDGFLSALAMKDIFKAMKKASAILIGCGLGVTNDTKMIVNEIIRSSEKPIIIDADGINCISDNIDILKEAKAPVILTPHPGEMSRLTKLPVSEIQNSRVKNAKSFAVENNVTLVLKGAGTVVADPKGDVYVNRTGNAGMAKGGTGDLLSGMMAAFVAQGMNTVDAAICAVHIHGAAGDSAAKRLSKMGMTASDMIDELPKLLSEYE